MAADGFTFAEGWEAKLGLEPAEVSDVPLFWLPPDWHTAYRPTEGNGKQKLKMCVSPKGLVMLGKQDVVEKAVEKPKTEAATVEAAAAEVTKASSTSVSAKGGESKSAGGDFHSEKIWTYDEVVDGGGIPGALTEKPAHWPDSCRPDPAANRRRVEWLPQGWWYGVKTTATGSELKVYVDPDGKMFYSKQSIEKAGVVLEVGNDWEPLEWPQWLPHDWGISRKLKKDGMYNTIYVRENFTHFQWHRTGVETYLRGNAGSEGSKLNVDPSLLPSAKHRKKETSAMTEDEIESSDFISVSGKLTEDGYAKC